VTTTTGLTHPLTLLVGSPGANHLSLRILRRSYPDAEGFWEGNWLKVEVAVHAGAFQGRFEADLRSDEFEHFAEQLTSAQRASEGLATLESAEGWVKLRLALEPRGGVEAACEVTDDPGLGSSLRFGLSSDQAQLSDLRHALGEVLRTFPVIGDPEEAAIDLLGPLHDLEPE